MILKSDELEKIIQITKKTGDLILDLKSQGLQISHKDNNEGPVTNADLAANRFLLEEIERVFPKDHLISEEEAPLLKEEHHPRAWFIDPIDGTSDFVKGNTEWSVMLGFAVEGKAAFGIVYQPEEDQFYCGGIGLPAFKLVNNKKVPIQCNSKNGIPEAIVVQSRSHPDSKVNMLLRTMPTQDGYFYGSIGLKAGHIAEGRGDFYLNFSSRCKVWDVCAPEAILHAAGGEFCFYQKEKEHRTYPFSFPFQSPAVLEPFHISSKNLTRSLTEVVRPYLQRKFDL